MVKEDLELTFSPGHTETTPTNRAVLPEEDLRADWTAAAAAAAAKSLQSCPTLRNPIDSSPPGSPAPRILQARTLEWVAISFSRIASLDDC